MQITVEGRSPLEARADLLALPFFQFDPSRWKLPARVSAIDAALGGRIGAALGSGDFRGKPGETVLLYTNDELPAKRVVLLGLGEESSLEADGLRRAAGVAVGQALARRAARVAFAVPSSRRVRGPAAAQALAEGAALAGYRFGDFRSSNGEPPAEVESVSFLVERSGDLRAARAAARTGATLGECQNVARQLSNQPANALTPAALARESQKIGKETGMRVQVMDVAELKRRKMGALLGVGQGSANTPRLIVMEHNAPARSRGKKAKTAKRGGRRGQTLCFVGKGITFDSGGISIKPSAGMDEMKHDMSGAAAVVGAMRACALLKVPQHVVGIVAAAENMPSGDAYRPGDVLTSMSGKTIEILNTDAEGRVVLADALHYARSEFEPDAIIDLATLTGACVIALGRWATGAFGNNERLVELVRRAGETTSERAWPMPLWEGHKQQMRSEVADIKNTGGREAGSSTAAAFLAAFVGDTPWVHLDIAGTGWTSKRGPYQPHGATGVGVRLLVEVLRGFKDARVV